MPLEQPSHPDSAEKEPLSYEDVRRLIGEFETDVHDAETWDEATMDKRRAEKIASHRFGLLDVFDINADAFRKQALRLMNDRHKRKLSPEEDHELVASHQQVTKLEAMAKATDLYTDLLGLYDTWSQEGLIADNALRTQIEAHKAEVAAVAQRKVDLSMQVISGAANVGTTYKEQDQLSERLRALLAATDADVPGGNADGVLPLHRGLLSMLENEYRMITEKQNVLVRSPEKTEDALKLLEGLQQRAAKNIERLTMLTMRMGRYQMYQTELTSVRHHFDQAYGATELPPRTGPPLQERKTTLPDFLTEQQEHAIGTIDQHIGKVESGVTKVGLIEKSETLWNEHARVFLGRLAERIATLETAWIPGERGSFIESALRERLLTGLAETMQWPRNTKGQLKSWAEMTPDEQASLKEKQDSIEKTIDRFQETQTLDRLKTSVGAAKTLIGRKDLAAENFIQEGEIDPAALPPDIVTSENIDQLVAKYGAPTVYKMTFMQLSANWEAYGESYGALLQGMNEVVGVHFDVAEFQKSFGDAQVEVMKLLVLLAALAGVGGVVGGWMLWRTGRFAVRQGARLGWRTAQIGARVGASVVRAAPGLIANPNAALPLAAIALETYRLNIVRGIKPLPEYQAVTDAIEFWEKHIEPDAYTKAEITHLKERQTTLAMIGNLSAPFEKPRSIDDVPRALKKSLPADFSDADIVLREEELQLREQAKLLQDRVPALKLKAEHVNADLKANFPIDSAFGSTEKKPGRTTVNVSDALAVREKAAAYRSSRNQEFAMRGLFKKGEKIDVPPLFSELEREYAEFQQYLESVSRFNAKVEERDRLIESLKGKK